MTYGKRLHMVSTMIFVKKKYGTGLSPLRLFTQASVRVNKAERDHP
jgi:hypothetical protein